MIHFTLFGFDITSEMLLPMLLLLSLIVSQFRKKIKGISPFHPVSLIVTLGNSGRSPIVPGTVGTLVSIYLLVYLTLLPRLQVIAPEAILVILIASTVVCYALGVWATGIYMRKTGRSDPKEVVIDELVGMYVAVILVVGFYSMCLKFDHDRFFYTLMLSPVYLVILFVLFRIYDMAKPFHVGWVDKNIKDAHGVMLDDVVAGVYAAVTFMILLLIVQYSGAMLWFFQTYFPDWVGAQAPKRIY